MKKRIERVREKKKEKEETECVEGGKLGLWIVKGMRNERVCSLG